MIKLYNTSTKAKEEFTPLDDKNVRMYVCGPTVYDRAHIGNARPVVVFDVLYRLLRHTYGADAVTYVRNFTDVDDKINAKAAETGRSIREITDETIGWYHDDMDALGTLRPNHEPRATEYIEQMKTMIAELMCPDKNGVKHAYLEQGHVLFAVDKYENYGQLSGRSIDDMIAGARVEVAPYKRNPMDFVLWKPSTGDQPGWESDWGYGRPGWHIECSAMARELLGEKFDIHGGGLDLQFPHHENEIAQTKCACGEDSFAQVWLHNEMLQVEGKKMSKSLGNFFTVRDLLDKGIPGEVIRFVLLSTHYRKPMDFSEKRIEEARETLERWYIKTDGIEADDKLIETVAAPLSNDLNTHLALRELDRWASTFNPETAGWLKAGMRFLGFPDAEQVNWFRRTQQTGSVISFSGIRMPETGPLEQLAERWMMLRTKKQYDEADRLKAGIEAAGVKLLNNGGVPVAELQSAFDPSKLEALK